MIDKFDSWQWGETKLVIKISIIDVPLPHLVRLYNFKVCIIFYLMRKKIDVFCMVKKTPIKKIWFLVYRKSGICIVNKGRLSLLLGVIHTGSCDYLPHDASCVMLWYSVAPILFHPSRAVSYGIFNLMRRKISAIINLFYAMMSRYLESFLFFFFLHPVGAFA